MIVVVVGWAFIRKNFKANLFFGWFIRLQKPNDKRMNEKKLNNLQYFYGVCGFKQRNFSYQKERVTNIKFEKKFKHETQY